MQTYSIALRISGKNLDVAEVTAKLRVNPTQTRIIGGYRSPKSVWDETMWEYDVRPTGNKVVWDTLEEGLQKLLSTLASRKRILRHYQRRFKVFFWCGHYSTSFGGPTLSPRLLKALGDFGVELILQSYLCDESDTG